jgi:dTMP kinase
MASPVEEPSPTTPAPGISVEPAPEAVAGAQADVSGDAAVAPEVVGPHDRAGQPAWVGRIFGSHDFFRLWLAQVASATGDWIGFLAIAAFATRVGAGSPDVAVSVVMAARIAPGFFLAPVGGVLVDRWDRKKVMVVCDLGRAATLAVLPFLDTVWGLVLASLVLEVFTLMWSPAKEASVPNLVPEDKLTSVNSLSLVAAYGTFPIASLLFAFLATVAVWLGEIPVLHFLSLNQEAVGFYFDVLTFLTSAFIISRLALPHLTRREREAAHPEGQDLGVTWGQAFRELKEGWHFIFIDPVVRAVMIGLGTGLIGGGMLVPLGPVFARVVLKSGTAGFGLLVTGLGVGVAVGVGTLSILQNRIPRTKVFSGAVLLAGFALMGAASMSTLWLAMLFVGVVGVCAGGVYVVGFTLLHENVSNDLRGRIF